MDSNLLTRRGFSLLETSFALLLVIVFMSSVICLAVRIKQGAFSQRVINELGAIATASLNYYAENGAWPANVADLRPGYLESQTGSLNPFGNAYTITGGLSSVSVSTVLPRGLISRDSLAGGAVVLTEGNTDLVSVTKSPESNNWKLKYEKKYIYH